MQAKIKFDGKGGELFVKLLVGGLLNAITLGVYTPWFMVQLNRYLLSKVTIEGRDFDIHPRFSGNGWEMFKIGLLGAFLSSITLGIYMPWFMARCLRYQAEHTEAVSESSRTYRFDFALTGGQLFGALFVGGLLMGITLGIYTSWFMCKMARLYADNLTVVDVEKNQKIGAVSFEGKGGTLFGTVFVNGLLCGITLGIYAPWAVVKTLRFWMVNTELVVDNQRWGLDFEGKGGTLFGRALLNGLLCSITLGIYTSWAMVDMLKYFWGNMVANPADGDQQAALPVKRSVAQLPAAEAIASLSQAREQARTR